MSARTTAGTWSAPGRANLIGEHTDYNDGFVLPFAIDFRTTVTASVREDGILRVRSAFAPDAVEIPLSRLDDAFPAAVADGLVPEWSAYPLGVAWAMRRQGAPGAQGVDLTFVSDVPVGAGLSSSAALECATAVALDELWGLEWDRTRLALAGQRAENEVVGAPTGIMDQLASMLGQSDAAVFLDCRTRDAEVVPLGLAAAELALLVIDTRVTHAHSTGGYGERRASCERGAHEMGVPALRDLSTADLPRARGLLDETTFRRVRHIVTENERVLETVRVLRTAGPAAIGELLLASHASMRDDFEISTPELNTAVESAVDAGALGARMTGGGFGGAAIALVRRADVDAIAESVAGAFAGRRFTAPHIFTVDPSPGARRD